jgi:hypothetical protein
MATTRTRTLLVSTATVIAIIAVNIAFVVVPPLTAVQWTPKDTDRFINYQIDADAMLAAGAFLLSSWKMVGGGGIYSLYYSGVLGPASSGRRITLG